MWQSIADRRPSAKMDRGPNEKAAERRNMTVIMSTKHYARLAFRLFFPAAAKTVGKGGVEIVEASFQS